MRIVLALSLAVGGAVLAATPEPPLWGPTWTAPFFQTITFGGVWMFNNSVSWYYDATTTPVGSSLYAHGRGQVDELCTSIVGHELDDSPCSLLATPDGWRRVFFPSPRAADGAAGAGGAAAAAAPPDNNGVSCCKYCNLTDYCGIVQPDWLRRGGAVYLGNATIGGRVCAHWQKQGGESNNWYAEVGTDLPCEYWEGYPELPSSNYWRFNNPAAINRKPIPPSIFAIPEQCESMCQTTHMTYAERLQARVDLELRKRAAAAAAE